VIEIESSALREFPSIYKSPVHEMLAASTISREVTPEHEI